jgi:hypothetical protein
MALMWHGFGLTVSQTLPWRRCANNTIEICTYLLPYTEAEFLDKSRQKPEEFSSLLFSVTSELCLEISISSNSRNPYSFYSSFYFTLQRRKEENLIENHTKVQ